MSSLLLQRNNKEAKLRFNSGQRNSLSFLFGLITFLLFFPMQGAVAQLLAPARIELPVARTDVPVYLTEVLGEKGMLLYFESSEQSPEGKRKWYFTRYDTALKEQWQQAAAISEGLRLKTAVVDGDDIFFVFVSQGKNSRFSGFEILRYDNQAGSFQLFGGSLPDKASVRGAAASHGKLLIGVNLPRYEADILLYDPENLTLTSLGHGIVGQTVVQGVFATEGSSHFYVGMKTFEAGRYTADVFLTFDAGGRMLSSYTYHASPYYLHSYSITHNEAGNMLVVGSFDNQESQKSRAKDALEPEMLQFESNGLFYLRFDASGAPEVRHHPFENFSGIYQAMATDDLMRARQRQARKKEGQTPDIGFQFYEPKLLQVPGKLLYASDAFKEQYRTETRMDYDFYGRLVPYTYTIFEGYQFFSALFTCFDNEGNVLWSNDLSLGDLLLPMLQHVSITWVDDTDFVHAFVRNGTLTSKILNDQGLEIGNTEEVRIESLFTNDRLTEENFSGIVHWYGPYFLVSGYQKITNNRLSNDNVRRVFYLQKMILEE